MKVKVQYLWLYAYWNGLQVMHHLSLKLNECYVLDKKKSCVEEILQQTAAEQLEFSFSFTP